MPSALLASIPATLLHRTGLVDMDAPLAPNLVAALTASLLTAAAVMFIYLALMRLEPSTALLTAVAIGLGTNYWPLVSRTLWQHETLAFGLALTLWAWLRPAGDLRARDLWMGGIGLALAGSARPQVAPLVAILLVWLATRAGARQAIVPAVIVSLAAAASIATNYAWFGHIFGGASRLEAVHLQTHAVEGSVSLTPWIGAAGLLVSPSRGLLVFSPILLAAAAMFGQRSQTMREYGLNWLGLAAAVQFAMYAAYTVWWGGHTFGPRYTLDLVVPIAPALALGLARLWTNTLGKVVAGVLLVWSIAVAAAGAFIYPNDAWNTSPAEVDRTHDRLWDVRDSQIHRVFTSDPSPQNFDLFSSEAVRKGPGAP
jgi:hypothetical protein